MKNSILKYLLAVIGFIIFILGAAGIDDSILIAFLLMVNGALLIIPYYREWRRIEKKRIYYNNRYNRSFSFDENVSKHK